MNAERESHAVRVLLVDDDEDDYVLTRDLLTESRRTRFEIEWISSFDRAVEAIRRNGFDVCLVDYRLGESDGLELLRRAREWGCRKPIIVMTGHGDSEIDVAAMRAGAADYLVKGQVDSQVLERSIRYSLEQARTLAALRESEERYALSARGANDGLWVWDLDRDHVYYSPRWKSMLGYEEGDIGSSPAEWFSRVHPDDAELLQTAIGMHRDGLTPHLEMEHRMQCSDGSYRWVLTRGIAVRDADGTPSRIAGSQTDITERKLAVERLTHDAFHDALTQLPNRALFMDRLGRALEVARRHPRSGYSVLVLDLDRFKVINDSLGHTFGDHLLVAVAERLREVVRSSDTVARLGGDEFAVLLNDVRDATDALRMAQRIHEHLGVSFRIGEHEVFTTVSIGIALSATGYERPEDVLRDADIAMYRAKQAGKSRHEVFDKTMHERAVNLLQMETDLRRALDRDELRLHYQPIVDLRDGRVVGFEALVRWQRGSEMIGAADIVPLAEETGLILPIGQWVLRKALAQVQHWRGMEMHVNLSPRQFLQANLVQQIEDALEETGADPQTLHLEVTESVLIDNPHAAASLLGKLRDARIRLSLDDFGTGYSSLSTLQQFPFDTLKIDRGFVSVDGQGRRALEIVRAIGNLARILRMDVTVEGVESLEQVEKMRELGLDYAQGYFFAPPLPAADVTELIARGARFA
ncbi:MAG TPA: EAL domain-containing protein [Thermoanaerobaculia bacterium]|nr:EAL domain-containing protein [Thermoanaerobaculia bacterium]